MFLEKHKKFLGEGEKENSHAVPVGELQIPDVASFLPKHI
jgi:hypothetical protein